MEMIGDYSENPFEGLYNDVPISTMARSIEIDIRQMLDETDLPEPLEPVGQYKIVL
jgi:ion channel-forming bestrophin family protein